MRDFVRDALFALGILLTAPLALLYRLSGSRALFAGQAQLLSLIPGKLGSYLRVAFYSMTLSTCPRKGYIGFGSYFSQPEVELGTGYYIGAYCIIGKARIGKHTTIASGVHILSGKHQHGYREIGKPIQEQPGVFTQVTIGENCWIGNGAIVMDDLGVQNVVAAGSVVTRASGNYEILAGNPAKVVKTLDGAKAVTVNS
jgi:acetyltransferase-like isoleucine patch superfamily enzyme